MTAALDILLVEDDEAIGSSLVEALTAEGWSLKWKQSGGEGLVAAADGPALVILDLGLGDMDGLDVCRQLRVTYPSLQILILTARDQEVDIVLGLDAGADDYLAKPFRLAELLARIRARLRVFSSVATSDEDRLGVGDLLVDVGAHRCFVGGKEVELRPKEFDLLVLLVRNAGRAVLRDDALRLVWDEHWYGSTKTLDIHVSTLRKKLEDAGSGAVITTLRGVGYRFELEST